MDTRKNAQAGFSLIELLVSMLITVIIMGAVVGLLTSGQSSFTTQPARTDRQQNMRMAMDVIMRDVQSAGVGMPTFVQTFTQGLAALGPDSGPAGLPWDELEILTNTSGFDNPEVCGAGLPGTANSVGGQVWLTTTKSGIAVGTDVTVSFANGTWTVRKVTGVTEDDATGAACTVGTHVLIDLDSDPATPQPGQLGNSGAAGIGNCGGAGVVCQTVTSIGLGRVVRYRVNRTAPGAVPHLERQENGGPVQILATGIEDLQLEYVQADGTVSQTAPAVTDPTYNTLITQVRATISARAADPRIQGATTSATAGVALRGSLQSQASPRQALWELTKEDPVPATPKWN